MCATEQGRGFAAKRSVTAAFPLPFNGCCSSDMIEALK